jgi:hypothetical protein
MKYVDVLFGWIVKFLSMLVLTLVPIHSVLIAVSVLVVADLATGIWASLKEHKPITSAGLRRTVVKTFAYQASVIMAFVIETYLLQGVPIIKVVAGLIAMSEGKSFFENLYRITGIDFWSAILVRIHGGSIKILPDDEK